MVTTRGWLQGRAKYLAMAIFNKTKTRLEWEYIYSRLCESIYAEDEDKKLIFVNWSEYQVIRKKIWQECPPNPPTNFDKITESVESLAEFIHKVTACCPFEFIDADVPCVIGSSEQRCINCIKEWLQKECD